MPFTNSNRNSTSSIPRSTNVPAVVGGRRLVIDMRRFPSTFIESLQVLEKEESFKEWRFGDDGNDCIVDRNGCSDDDRRGSER